MKNFTGSNESFKVYWKGINGPDQSQFYESVSPFLKGSDNEFGGRSDPTEFSLISLCSMKLALNQIKVRVCWCLFFSSLFFLWHRPYLQFVIDDLLLPISIPKLVKVTLISCLNSSNSLPGDSGRRTQCLVPTSTRFWSLFCLPSKSLKSQICIEEKFI